MPIYDNDDGTVRPNGREYWHVHGYVTLRVYVNYDTYADVEDSEFDNDLTDAIIDALDDYDVIDEELEYEIREDEE